MCVCEVEKTVRSGWRECRLQVTCHAESGCLECGCADDDKGQVAAMVPHCSACQRESHMFTRRLDPPASFNTGEKAQPTMCDHTSKSDILQ
jgi:hypothetical protein